MAIYNSMLNIMPYNCRYCVQGFKALEHISQEAINQSLNLIEIQKEQAVKGPVWDTLTSTDPIFVNGFGHGSPEIYTGDTTQAIFTNLECDILAGRVVYLLSCYTAIALGPAIIDVGGLAYAGYNIAWTWMTENVEEDPYKLYLAEGFYRSSNEFPISLIQGYTMLIAKERCLAEYNRWIEIWETERANDVRSADAIKWLIHDRDGLTVLGNLDEVIVTTGKLALIEFFTEPPSKVHTGEVFRVEGRLIKRETEEPLANKTIELRILGVQEPIARTTTDTLGNWMFDISLDKGIASIFLTFPGDEEYSRCYSKIFSIGVGLTEMKITIPPDSFIDVGGKLIFLGTLVDQKTKTGIPNKVVSLKGITADSIVTNANGEWNFEVLCSTEARYLVHVEFEEDIEFVGSKTAGYRVSVGLLPIFGYDQRGNTLRSAVNRIVGTVFVAPEDGIVMSMMPFIQYTGIASGKMKCAIYKHSDLSLLGVTEEREFVSSDGRIIDWTALVFKNPPKIKKGEKYIFAGWASAYITMYYRQTTEVDKGVELHLEYGDYPDPLVPERVRNTEYSIYCEYKKEVTEMEVTFAGTVSAQAAAGEEVTITVTLPDGGTEQVVALTQDDRSYSIPYSNEPGNYKAKARVEEDALYQAAESDEVPFVIGKEPRTITLRVS